MALVGYQKGDCRMPVETMRCFLLDMFHLPVSQQAGDGAGAEGQRGLGAFLVTIISENLYATNPAQGFGEIRYTVFPISAALSGRMLATW